MCLTTCSNSICTNPDLALARVPASGPDLTTYLLMYIPFTAGISCAAHGTHFDLVLHVHVEACLHQATRLLYADSGHGLEAGLWLSACVMGLLWQAWSARLDM